MAKHRFNIKFFFADVSVKYYEVISCPMAKHRFNISVFSCVCICEIIISNLL